MTISLGRNSARARQPVNMTLRLVTMIAVARQRRALRNLDDHLLCDIGVSSRDAAREASRPIWDVPANWRK